MTRPLLQQFAKAPPAIRGPGEPFEFIYDKRTGLRHIPLQVDHRYRKGLTEAAGKAPRNVRWYIRNALENGPDRDGAAGAIRYFGNELDAKLKLTAQMVDTLEVALPGFKRWLEVTGFGNDKTMIKAFVAWAEAEVNYGQQVEHILPATRRVLNG